VSIGWGWWWQLHLRLYHSSLYTVARWIDLCLLLQDLGWNWTYGICACLYGLFIILILLFVPETLYKRDPAYNIDLGTTDHAEEILDAKAVVSGDPKDLELSKSGNKIHTGVVYSGADERPYTFWEELMPFHGIYSDDNLLFIILRPFGMLLFPQVLYGFITYGLSTSWLVVMISVLAQLFTAAPYNFSVADVGLVSIAPMVASFCGFLAGPLNDFTVKRLARMNKGIYEPEFRLALNILTLIIGVIGFFGFGASLAHQNPWPGPVILYGLIYFAMSFLNIGLVSCVRSKTPI